MDIRSSKYTKRLRSHDDTFSKPSGRPKADRSIRCARRCKAHHMNTDFNEFNMRRSLDIHSPIQWMHHIIQDVTASHWRRLQWRTVDYHQSEFSVWDGVDKIWIDLEKSHLSWVDTTIVDWKSGNSFSSSRWLITWRCTILSRIFDKCGRLETGL